MPTCHYSNPSPRKDLGVVSACQNAESYTGYMGVSKNRVKTPKMDGENNGNPY